MIASRTHSDVDTYVITKQCIHMTPYAGPVAASCSVISELKHRINVKQEIMACEVGGEVEKVGLFLDYSISFGEKKYIFCLELITKYTYYCTQSFHYLISRHIIGFHLRSEVIPSSFR